MQMEDFPKINTFFSLFFNPCFTFCIISKCIITFLINEELILANQFPHFHIRIENVPTTRSNEVRQKEIKPTQFIIRT